MKKTILILAVAALAASCHGKSTLRRDQQNYNVVQEGSAGAVTSTIQGPGEVPAPVAPMTATNADTTSTLSLLNGTATAPGVPGTLAGTLPSDRSGSMSMGYPSDPGNPGSATRPRVTRPSVPRVAATQTTQPEVPHADTTATATQPMTSASPPSAAAPPVQSTAAAEPSPTQPSSDTTATATPEGSEKPKDKPRESKPTDTAPPSTDTTTTTAPPPTST